MTHTFTGAVLADAGLRRATPLATAGLMVAANIPDVDILTFVGGEYRTLALRRGWTHGLPAVAVWPFVVTLLLLAWDRAVRRRRKPELPPLRVLPMLGITFLGVLTHPALDWLNTYGMRWLMPLSGTWTYGDVLFIVDPWLWLVLGGALLIRHSRGRSALAAWVGFFALASLLVLGVDAVPAGSKLAWGVGLVVLAALRLGRWGAAGTRAARNAVTLALAYVGFMMAADLRSAAAVVDAARERGLEVRDVMVAPRPADPLSGRFVIRTPDAFVEGVVRRPWAPEVVFAPGRQPVR
ncbi:MAG TPA: metal-dependent hydrolase, partial [Longimicrobiales bacterium]|nr:metal-dependent hydrolase [Longimicrobiales bacterium]